MKPKYGLFLTIALSFLAFSFGARADEHSDKHDDKKHEDSHKSSSQPSGGKHDQAAPGHDHAASGHEHADTGHDHPADAHDHSGGAHEHPADNHDHPASGHDHSGDRHDRGASHPNDHSGHVHDAQHGREHPFNREEFHQRMSMHPSHDQRIQAHERWNGERARFVRAAGPFRFLPGYRPLLHGMRIVPGTYYYRRGVFYDSFGWVTPPWTYNMYPRYGLWDTNFLAFALAHILEPPYALFFYHHWREPEIVQWMADTNRLAAENAELRAQVDAMNARTAEIGQTGVTRDPTYVPEDAQDIALSPDAIDQLTKQQ